ncbi:helix-hairpin-helix domain-containing protein [Nostoc edaphicum CCNP1411]|uniref:Helix-hairpin-helix domain-containing protein n=1 Tax=Nostoc edaphicum CCNP1411 TaxID=1472755 RepID=A0A7D7LAU1_9NOSO|nr:helix-hairpin-helix domain-containing protein [Nostoc edaphicum]QMS86729.1 helix-hairpin-helix domain-containing protein [Nostoc edaphicum CCNP1411]
MKLATSLVAVKKITSSKLRSIFADDELEQAARLILDSEGVINPIVVRRTSLQSYEVVDGDFEYFAAVRAREIDPRKGEMIGVFIIESENEETLTKQVKLFRKSKALIAKNISVSSDGIESPLINTESRFINTESRMTNLESRFENRTIELQTEFRLEIKNINDRLKEIENRIPKPMEPLEALNTLSLSELTSKLRRVGINIKIIEKIISERNNGKFKSFSNVVDRIKGLGDKTMLKIIDSFAEGSV